MCYKGQDKGLPSCSFLRHDTTRQMKHWKVISGYDSSWCNLACVIPPAGGVCLQITVANYPRSVRVCSSETSVCTCPHRVCYVHRALFAFPSPACGEYPTMVLVPPRNFLHTTSTVRSNFRDTYNWFPDTAVPREWGSTRCVDYRQKERQIVRAGAACLRVIQVRLAE